MSRSIHPSVALAMMVVAASTAAPALAQQPPSQPYNPATGGQYGYQPPAGTPVTPHGQGGYGSIPPIEQQNRAAASVQGSLAGQGTEALLRDAELALQQRNFGIANELLERAQTQSMNAAQAAGSSPSPLTTAIGDARKALVDGNTQVARERIGSVLDTMKLGAAAMAAPSGPGIAAVPR